MSTQNTDVNIHIPIGEVVRAWREARGWSQSELAERAGRPLTKQYLSQLKRGKIRTPGPQHLRCLARALQCSIADLLTRRFPESIGARGEASGKDRRLFRFGAGLQVVTPRSRSDALREILRQTEQIKRMVEELLQAEEKEARAR